MDNVEVIDMDISTPVDADFAISTLGGEPAIFFQMLSSLEDISLRKSLQDIAPEFDANNYEMIKFHAHSIKGASGYVGATHLYYACYYI
mmetsp:Transcript_33066/g.50723  ORF Transcript_33066/g.50723 Transcript_33066/m.50723 type:complete len:89 (+) Transcript_33066:27-293(+)|eukprot:CAMPEP_0170495218 /NCGR_PEP_ID=MMETSP0208-20121228/15084_1 /TAXON_ID=197538 /ORGANISM="Strombidium inclinatum, Strain S3" /LENGTH=88 /DNA_ID=CAMNT_0010771377 /DNA_START=23 /DNA_END=289 /DNA_ORIENTATION=+